MFAYSVINFRNIFHNIKWFPKLIHKKPNELVFFKHKMIIVPTWQYAERHYYLRRRMFKSYSSKIQIYRHKDYLIIVWYLYSFKFFFNKDKDYFKRALKDPIVRNPVKGHDRSKFRIHKVLLLKLFIIFKSYNYNVYSTTNNNLFNYELPLNTGYNFDNAKTQYIDDTI